MEQIIGNYYGIDWIAMTGSLIFLFLIGNKKRYAFIIYAVTSVAWIIVNYMAEIWPGVIVCIILIVLNIRAYIKWEE
jgi:hypothetical protein